MYVISYTGLFVHGYVQTTLSLRKKSRSESVLFETYDQALSFATKFQFKFWADFNCWLLNVTARKNYDLLTYRVEKVKSKK